MRSLLGLVLVVYSAWSTIQVAGAAFPDVAWWHVGVGLGMSLGYILGALLAGAITLSEVYLGESRPFAYLLIVAFDAYLTQQYSSWAYDLLHSAITITNLSLEAFLVGALVWFASGLCAYFGEVLLLGSRRRARWKQR
jgi:hypothetical protein